MVLRKSKRGKKDQRRCPAEGDWGRGACGKDFLGGVLAEKKN